VNGTLVDKSEHQEAWEGLIVRIVGNNLAVLEDILNLSAIDGSLKHPFHRVPREQDLTGFNKHLFYPVQEIGH